MKRPLAPKRDEEALHEEAEHHREGLLKELRAHEAARRAGAAAESTSTPEPAAPVEPETPAPPDA